MLRKLIYVVPVAVFVLMAALFGMQPGQETSAIRQFEADRSMMEELVEQVLREGTESPEIPAPWLGIKVYRTDLLTVEFALGGTGIGSEMKYWGINYVPDDEPIGFQGRRWDYWKQDGNGRMYYDPESDNSCYVKKLDQCWYYYEMSF